MHGDIKKGFEQCRWFSRGWTLQELLAPNVVEFYDYRWVLRGDKISLQFEISLVTGIDTSVLLNRDLLPTMPVAKRMSWAAYRQTTRQEDIAYCLLGIFDVHMPLIYGEGGNAFTRLQERIIESGNDMSVFAWNSDDQDSETQAYRGILARSPYEFRLCQTVEKAEDYTAAGHKFFLANNTLRFQIGLRKTPNEYSIDLATKRRTSRGTRRLILYLAKTPSGFVRQRSGETIMGPGDDQSSAGKQSTIYIAKDVSPEESLSLEKLLGEPFEIAFELPANIQLASIKAQPSRLWDPQKKSFFIIESGEAYWVFVSIVINNLKSGSSTSLAVVCELCAQPGTEDVLAWATMCSKGDLLTRVTKHTDAEDATDGLPRKLKFLCSQLSSISSYGPCRVRLDSGEVLLELLPRGIKFSYSANAANRIDKHSGSAVSSHQTGPIQTPVPSPSGPVSPSSGPVPSYAGQIRPPPANKSHEIVQYYGNVDQRVLSLRMTPQGNVRDSSSPHCRPPIVYNHSQLSLPGPYTVEINYTSPRDDTRRPELKRPRTPTLRPPAVYTSSQRSYQPSLTYPPPQRLLTHSRSNLFLAQQVYPPPYPPSPYYGQPPTALYPPPRQSLSQQQSTTPVKTWPPRPPSPYPLPSSTKVPDRGPQGFERRPEYDTRSSTWSRYVNGDEGI